MLWVIGSRGLTFDGVEDSVVILLTIQQTFYVDTHTGIDVVKLVHLVAGKLYEYEIGIVLAVLIPGVIYDEFPLDKGLATIFGRYLY